MYGGVSGDSDFARQRVFAPITPHGPIEPRFRQSTMQLNQTLLLGTVSLLLTYAVAVDGNVSVAGQSTAVGRSAGNGSEKSLTSHSADPMPEFAYRTVRIGLHTLGGKPVPGARVYGYCPGFHLVWPRTERFSKGTDQHQNDLPWQEEYLGRTGPDGMVTARIPPGRWAFFACGTSPHNGPTKKIVAAWTDYAQVASDSKILLRPTVEKHWSFKAPGTGALRHRRFFLRPEHLPIWVPVGVPRARKVTFEIPDTGSLNLWGQGDIYHKDPAFSLYWGKLGSASPDGTVQTNKAPATMTLQASRGLTSLYWFLHGQYGLTGQIRLGTAGTALLSPGEYSLGYTHPVRRSTLAEFVPKYCQIRGGKKYSFDIGATLTAGLKEDRHYACLFVVSRNGFLLRRFLTNTGEGMPFRATLWIDGKKHRTRQVAPGRTLFKTYRGLSPEETKDAVREWTFELPVTIQPKGRVTVDRTTIVASNHFWTTVPAVLESPITNFLKQADRFENQMRQTSQRTKRGVPRTWLRFPIRQGGASATHLGTRITFPSELLYQDIPTLDHVFGHELAHNFKLYHGGLLELIVEATRCADNKHITGQLSSWLFMDRMNGIERKETWYPHTGFYLYGYCQEGPKFLRFVSHYEESARGTLANKGVSKEVTTVALSNIALKRNLFDIGRRYGLCSEMVQHTAAVDAVKKLVKKTGPPRPATNPRQILSNPPGWIALAGNWRLDGGTLVGRRVRGLGSTPRMVYGKMPRTPFEISFSQKSRNNRDNYVRLDLTLGIAAYRFVLEKNHLQILGPGKKQEFAGAVRPGKDTLHQLRIHVREKDIVVAANGMPVHSIRRTGHAPPKDSSSCGGRNVAP